MKVTVLAVGRPRPPLAAAIAEYEARAARFWNLEVVEIREAAGRGSDAADTVRRTESARLAGRVPSGADVVLLTRTGRPMSSGELARYLEGLAVHGHPGAAFIIGGAEGIDEAAFARVARRLSLSAMTLPHELARLVLAEQLYRAGTILRGEPYHRGG